jgi:hypothetical protein
MRVWREFADGSAEFRRLPERVRPEEMVETQPVRPPVEAWPVGTQDTEWQLRAGGLG